MFRDANRPLWRMCKTQKGSGYPEPFFSIQSVAELLLLRATIAANSVNSSDREIRQPHRHITQLGAALRHSSSSSVR